MNQTKISNNKVEIEVIGMLVQDSSVPFIFLQPDQVPVKTERFQDVNVTVVSGSCDSDILFNKARTVIKALRLGRTALVAKSVTLKQIGYRGPNQWELTIDGWWVGSV